MNRIINNKNKPWILFIGILLCFLLADGLLALIYYDMGGNIASLTTTQTMYFLLAKYFILIIIFILAYRKYLKEKWYDFLKNFKSYFKISLKNWFIGFLIMIISNIIINSFVSGLGQNENLVQSFIAETPAIAFIITTFLAPFIEEMIFRKSLKDCFKNKTIYMITSAILFGLIHCLVSDNLYEYLLIIPYGALGFMFAKTNWETDNVYSSIFMHMLHNGILTILAIGVY